MATLLFQPTPHEEAAAFLRNKPAVSRAVFDKLVPELKARAFTIAGIEGLGVLTSVRDTIATLPEGGDWETLKKQIVSDIDPYFVDPEADAETQGKQRYAAERRAELLLRTHGQQAYAAAAWREADEQRDLFPFWKYQTLGDGHVRPSHAALDGIVLPHDDPFWETHTPPWDWGCRCQFIPLSDADVAELKDADKKLPPEQQRVLDEPARKKLQDEKSIYRPSNLATGTGHPVPYSIASPAERGKPNAYTFRPGDLRLDAAAIQSRHDPKDWAQFEQWAKNQKLPGQGKTVWEWMNGATPLPKAEIPSAPAPAPEQRPAQKPLPPIPAPVPAKPTPPKAIAKKPAPPPAKDQPDVIVPLLKPAVPAPSLPPPISLAPTRQISNKTRLLGSEKTNQLAKTTITEIEKIHGGFGMPAISISDKKMLSNAIYQHREDGSPIGIFVNPDRADALSIAHEIGHWFDHHALGDGAAFGSQGPELKPLMDAMRESASMQRLKSLKLKGRDARDRRYLLDDKELFARGYSQFIAAESRNPDLLKAVASRVNIGDFSDQWPEDEFQAIHSQFRTFFKSKQLLKTND